MPLISFVVAVYNNEKYLSSAVYSIVRQKIEDRQLIEVIIVDDGSTDNTPAIADRLSAEDDRITVIHQTNQWIYASFNNGIKNAKGEYIYILNSDDKMIDGSIQLLIDCIKKYNKPDVIWTKVLWCDVDEKQNILYERDMNSAIVKDEYFDEVNSIHNKWIEIQKTGLNVNQANLYKRELSLSHPFRNDVYGADTFFNISIADSIKSMAILKDNIYMYLAYNNPTMNASIEKYYDYDHKMFNEMMLQEACLYQKWNCDDKCLDYVVLKRLRGIMHEIKALGFRNCPLSWEEKIAKIFGEIADSEIRSYARKVGREREYESRILNGTKELLIRNNKLSEAPAYVDSLIRFLPDDYRENVDEKALDIEAIQVAVNCKFNKDKIGKVYYSEDW